MKEELSTASSEAAPARKKTASVLRVDGTVTNPLTLSLDDLRSMETEEITDFPVICESGEPKGRFSRCRGVLLETILTKAKIITYDERTVNRIYFDVTADDGYRVIFSWNEVFNTSVGEGVMVLIEKEGLHLHNDDGDFTLVSANDNLNGSRYVKKLRHIEVVTL